LLPPSGGARHRVRGKKTSIIRSLAVGHKKKGERREITSDFPRRPERKNAVRLAALVASSAQKKRERGGGTSRLDQEEKKKLERFDLLPWRRFRREKKKKKPSRAWRCPHSAGARRRKGEGTESVGNNLLHQSCAAGRGKKKEGRGVSVVGHFRQYLSQQKGNPRKNSLKSGRSMPTVKKKKRGGRFRPRTLIPARNERKSDRLALGKKKEGGRGAISLITSKPRGKKKESA